MYTCRLCNLLEDNDEWDNCLGEAGGFQMPTQLWCLFATICIFCHPTDTLQLWLGHKSAMMGDFSRAHNADTAENLALMDILQLLSVHGFSCADWHLPNPLPSNQLPVTDNDQTEQQTQGAERMAQLNDKQREAVDSILCGWLHTYIISNTRALLSIGGPGGTGECEFCMDWSTFTFELALYNVLMYFLFRRKLCVQHIDQCSARKKSEGGSDFGLAFAAQLLSEGRTLLSPFKLPVPILDTSTCNVSPTTPHAAMLRGLHLTIFDKASMIPAHALCASHLLLRDLMNNYHTHLVGRSCCLEETLGRFSQ